MHNLNQILNQLESKIPHHDVMNADVSQTDAGWHMEHSMLTINGITNSLIKSNPDLYKGKFKLIKLIVFTMGKIPRGKAKAPKVVQPSSAISKDSLMKHLEETRLKINELKTISNDKYFDHPVFGHLKLKDTIRFLEIHTNHHLKIVEDILKEK